MTTTQIMLALFSVAVLIWSYFDYYKWKALVLSPSDAKKVIEMSWGELHPLAGRFIPVKTYLFIYAPRNEADLGVIQQILGAAIL